MRQQELHRYLIESTGRPITLRVNDNTHSLLTATRGRDRHEINVSVHRMFLRAEDDVLRALAEFIVRPNAANRRLIRQYIAFNGHQIKQRAQAFHYRTGRAKGEHYDLEPIAARLNKRFFGGELKFGVEWGRRPAKPPRRMKNITLGVCHANRGVIRINPILDNARVPLYYLEYVLYHEMVHVAVPATVSATGRQMHHTADFYEMERRFPQYREAMAWQQRSLPSLLDAWCRPSKSRRGDDAQLRFL